MVRRLCVASVGVNVLIIVAAGTFVMGHGGVSFLRKQLNQNKAVRIEAFPPVTQDACVLLGDSVISCYEWHEVLGPKVCNSGFGGDTTSKILARLDAVTQGRPRQVMIEAGINDLAYGVSPAQVAEEYRRIIETIHTDSPTTTIYIIGVMPPAPKYRASIPKGSIFPTPELVQSLNALLAGIPGAQFISTEPLCDASGIKPEYTADGLHPNRAGFLRLAEILRPHVRAQDCCESDS